MKTILFFIYFFVVYIIFCTYFEQLFSQENKTNISNYHSISPFKLEIESSKPEYTAFDHIIISIITLNPTKECLKYFRYSNGTLFPYSGHIMYNNKIAIPLTKYGKNKQMGSLTEFGKHVITVSQGQKSPDFTVPINRYYDMSLDGIYNIKFKQYSDIYFEKDSPNDLVSNDLIIKIDSSTVNIADIFSNDTKKNWGNQTQGITISAVTNQNHYKNYTPILLQIATKNIDNHVLKLVSDMDNIFNVYDLKLKTPGFNKDFRDTKERLEGWKYEYAVKDAALTLYGQKLFSEKSKEPKPIVTVKPGEEVAETVIVLNRIFDMSEDGIYGLIVSRKIIDENGKEQTVTSDPLPIRVGTALPQDEIDQRIKKRQEQEKTEK
jgi:hypothetical protein